MPQKGKTTAWNRGTAGFSFLGENPIRYHFNIKSQKINHPASIPREGDRPQGGAGPPRQGSCPPAATTRAAPVFPAPPVKTLFRPICYLCIGRSSCAVSCLGIPFWSFRSHHTWFPAFNLSARDVQHLSFGGFCPFAYRKAGFAWTFCKDFFAPPFLFLRLPEIRHQFRNT